MVETDRTAREEGIKSSGDAQDGPPLGKIELWGPDDAGDSPVLEGRRPASGRALAKSLPPLCPSVSLSAKWASWTG